MIVELVQLVARQRGLDARQLAAAVLRQQDASADATYRAWACFADIPTEDEAAKLSRIVGVPEADVRRSLDRQPDTKPDDEDAVAEAWLRWST